MNNSFFRLVFISVLIIFLSSCAQEDKNVYISNVNTLAWDKNNSTSMYHMNNDTVSAQKISVLVRLMPKYGYDGINLSLETLSPKGEMWVDTISLSAKQHIQIAQSNRTTLHLDLIEEYRSNVVFNKIGSYRFRIRHIMPDSLLSGVIGVGIEIDK